MKEHAVKFGSWHHKLAVEGGLGSKTQTTACAYALAVLRGAVELTFLFTLMAVFALALVFLLSFYVYGLYLLSFGGVGFSSLLIGGPELPFHKSFGLVSVLMITSALIFLLAAKSVDVLREKLQAERQRAAPQQSTNVAALLWRSLRDKVCYTVVIK